MKDEVRLTLEDPRAPAGETLIAELIAFLDLLYPEDADETPASWTLEDIARSGGFVVVRIKGVVAGCGGLAPIPLDGALEVVRMFVRPDYRGLRLADRVLAELERLARDRGVEVLMLRCGPRQPGALRVYERNGFVTRPAFAYHREHPTNIFYEKQLTCDLRTDPDASIGRN